MSFKSNISSGCLENANSLIQIILHASKPLLFCVSLLLVVAWLTGKKLSRFVKPEKPKTSTIIREIASILSLISLIVLVMFLIYSLVIFSLVLFAYWLLAQPQAQSFLSVLSLTAQNIWAVAGSSLIAVFTGSFIGFSSSMYLNYFLIPDWERGEGLHDVNSIIKMFKKLNSFNPVPHIDVAQGCFIGLDLKKAPIYITWKKIRETHIQILGSTGAGKGVVMTLIASQSALAGECVIWFDPKNDRFSSKILSAIAKKAGKEFHLINLNPDQPPQFNILADAKSHEIEELLVAGFDLIGKGSDGDFYRGKDEDAAIQASKIAIENNATSIPALIQQCALIEDITSQENFWRKLNKLGGLEVINTEKGINLIDAINKGAIIYIIGSTENERVKMLQKMLLVRIMQIIKKQDRSKNLRPICSVLDEFKHLLSPTALTGLGVVRDFNVHFLLAHQSLGDLDSCAGITRAQAEGAVLDNTAIKIIYKLGDSDYAEKLSKNSGKRPIFVEQSNKSLGDDNIGTGGWRETHVPVIDADVLTHLPMSTDREGQANTGVIFGVGIAKLFYVGPIPVSGNSPLPKSAPKYQRNPTTTTRDLI